MSLKKGFFLAGGGLSLALAVLGIILPVLPATPFLLAASFCFLKGSDRAHRWLVSNPFLGPRLERIRSGKGLTKKEKITIYATAFAMILPVALLTSSLHLRLFLFALLGVKAVVFLRMRTAP